MKSLISKIVAGTALLLPLGMASGAALTDIVVFNADASGNYAAGPAWSIWNTRGGDMIANTWVQSAGGTFLTGPADAGARPNIVLGAGSTSFRLLAGGGGYNPNFGISLFFDGATTPSISAYGPTRIVDGPSSFAADGAPSTPDPVYTWHSLKPGAGTLSFVAGDQLVTLTDFYWASSSLYQLDLIGAFSGQPDGAMDFVGGITLTVTPIPEPGVSIFLLALALGALGIRRQIR